MSGESENSSIENISGQFGDYEEYSKGKTNRQLQNEGEWSQCTSNINIESIDLAKARKSFRLKRGRNGTYSNKQKQESGQYLKKYMTNLAVRRFGSEENKLQLF